VWWAELILSFAAGLLLGALFYGGLWWTVQRIPAAGRPAPLILGSFVVRTALVLAGFFLLLRGGGAAWLRLLAALGGIMAVRLFMIYKVRPKAAAVLERAGAGEAKNDD
jgi:F1F0 ATPase subunit 2